MANHEIPAEVHNGVSTLDVPSAKWGWSDQGRTGVQIAGWISVLVLLAYNFGNHEGHVETVFLFAFAIVIALGLVIHLFQPKLSQVRTVTAHNQPEGHIEPDWCYNQHTLSGNYARLTDSQLRALNIDPERVGHLREIEASADERHPAVH